MTGVTGIANVIARAEFIGRDANGEEFPIVIEIGQPFSPDDFSTTTGACEIAVLPFLKRFTIYGEGSFQALCLALRHVQRELIHFQEGGGILRYEGGGDGDQIDLADFWLMKRD